MVRSPVIGPLVAVALDLGRDEGQLRVGLDVEEVAGPEVAVAVGGAGVDAAGVDGQVDPGGGRVRGVDGGGAVEVRERAADGGDHRVAGREAEAAVGHVEGVVAGDVLDGGGAGVEVRLDDGGAALAAVEETHLLLTPG